MNKSPVIPVHESIMYDILERMSVQKVSGTKGVSIVVGVHPKYGRIVCVNPPSETMYLVLVNLINENEAENESANAE